MSATPAAEPGELAGPGPVLAIGEGYTAELRALLGRFAVELKLVPRGVPIPGSYWGEPEAGVVAGTIWAREDTPVHSVLHEACHVLCMDGGRRMALTRDAGGDFDEENAVCCLQILLAAELPGIGAERLMRDMDAWGYTFRLGSARAWYAREAADARGWLMRHGLLDTRGRLTGRRRA
ncbi:MAG TPA: hypothetical protein VN790_01030 [Steroidobacteraceae bacterium]|nr:hypothetical protein [Steroidobacteraceae bacterium]